MVFFQNKVDLEKHAFLYLDCTGLCLIAYCRNFQYKMSYRKIIDCEMSGIISADTYCRALKHYENMGDVFSCRFIYNMTIDVCISVFGSGRQHNT